MNGICGIYSIKNKINNKYYIGSSIDIDNRFKAHVYHLESNKHHSIHLQRSWNKYGKDIFEFSIVEECDESLLFEREQLYINQYNSIVPNGFNLKDAGPRGKLSLESIDKFSKVKIGENNPMFGKVHSDNTKLKISKANSKPKDEQTKIKMSEARKEKYSKDNAPRSILSKEDALTILNKLKKGAKVKNLAKKYNVSEQTIYGIKNGHHWICKQI